MRCSFNTSLAKKLAPTANVQQSQPPTLRILPFFLNAENMALGLGTSKYPELLSADLDRGTVDQKELHELLKVQTARAILVHHSQGSSYGGSSKITGYTSTLGSLPPKEPLLPFTKCTQISGNFKSSPAGSASQPPDCLNWPLLLGLDHNISKLFAARCLDGVIPKDFNTSSWEAQPTFGNMLQALQALAASCSALGH